MPYTQTDALYDVMSVQVPLSFVLTLLTTAGALNGMTYTWTDVLLFSSGSLFLWFCFSLMFFSLDLLVLTPIFSILRFWNTLECERRGSDPAFIAQAKNISII